MSAPRRLASRLLHAVVRQSSSDSRDWASAMLGELDFIESDWAALFWALGSTSAIFKHSVPRAFRAWLRNWSTKEEGPTLKNIRTNAAGTLSGILIAVAVLVGAFGLVRLLFVLFPGSDMKQLQWAELLGVIVVPEAIFILAAWALWRKRRSLAVGITMAAVTLVAHVVVHLTTR